MKFSTTAAALLLASLAAAVPVSKRQTGLVRGPTTLVFFEVNGVPGNECLTFRNNGEIVDAACVNTAIDRQMTPSTFNGQNVLLVQRTFTADFRPDLVNKQVCVGFNGTDFLAQDCATATAFVSLQGDELRVGDAAARKRGVVQVERESVVEISARAGKNHKHKAAKGAAAAAAAAGAGAGAAGAGAAAAAGAAASTGAAATSAAATGTGACQSGHDSLAQVTVDPTGQTCATFTTTTVAATAP